MISKISSDISKSANGPHNVLEKINSIDSQSSEDSNDEQSDDDV